MRTDTSDKDLSAEIRATIDRVASLMNEAHERGISVEFSINMTDATLVRKFEANVVIRKTL